MFSYNDIPVKINGEIHRFDFQYLEESPAGQTCTITGAGRVLIVDENFAVVRTDMPGNWVDPAIYKLRELAAGSQTPL